MSIPFVSPTFQRSAFNCPYCNAFAAQNWLHVFKHFPASDPFEAASKSFFMSRCAHCKLVATWHDGIMLVPDSSSSPQPHEDMPAAVIPDYEEARSVLQRSPRSTAALLRLALQKLCVELGEKGENINEDIKQLVAKGLPVEVQQALDIVRVVGNEQVHPGELDIRDDPSIALELFKLINFIVEDRISRPKNIQRLYSRLPDGKLDGIKRRDA
jgi:hypothetical protein